jgi:hypothetical protein
LLSQCRFADANDYSMLDKMYKKCCKPLHNTLQQA